MSALRTAPGGADKTCGVLQAWGFSDRGAVRPVNEDRFAIDIGRRLCVVADGMGGHNAGAIAADTAVDAVLDVVADPHPIGWSFGIDPSLSESGNLIRTAICVANMRVLEAAGSAAGCAGMGTTIVAALVHDGRLAVGHVGDSRLYRLTGGRLRQLTGDDSWMAVAIASNPRADAGRFEHHPLRHALTNVVGGRTRTEVHVLEEPLSPGDQLLLTTDGVHGVLDDARIETLMQNAGAGTEAPAQIVRAAIARGSRDNCTAIVARYEAQSRIPQAPGPVCSYCPRP